MVDKIYQLKQSVENSDTTELLIYGEITAYAWTDADKGAFDLSQELASVTTPNLLVRINSPGGEASQGLGIYNLLKSFKGKVTTIIDGFACSAASVVFMAGEERIMPRTSLLMIHNAWTYGEGDSNDFKKIAERLEKVTQPIIEVYKITGNLAEAQIKTMMDNETWISADEALDYGFATKVQEDVVKQSLENGFVHKLVMKIKEYEKLLDKETTSQEQPKDAWSSFFKGTKGN